MLRRFMYKLIQERIQAFPEDMLTYNFANFLPKPAWKWKNLDPKVLLRNVSM